MAQHPLHLLKHVVSPQVVAASDPLFQAKSEVLDQFYPILLSIFAQQPERVQQVLQNSGDSLGMLLGSQQTALNPILENMAQYHALPVPEVKSLVQSAIPVSAKALIDEAPDGNVAAYLKNYASTIAKNVPAWAIPLLGILGLDSALYHETPSHIAPVHQTQESNFFRKILPLIAVLILLLLFFFWRSCQHYQEPVKSAVPVQSSNNSVPAILTPVSLALTSGLNDQLFACHAQTGNTELGQAVAAAVREVFPGQRLCNVTVDQAYNNTLPGQQSLADILERVKATPNASLQWTGDQIIINAPSATDVTRLVDQIKALAPELTVTGAAPLNVDQSVTTSINAARTALSGLQATTMRPEDVVRALNLQIINFATDSAVIPEQNKEILDQAATLIQQVPNIALTIQGYTDSTGDAVHNKTLSEQRAKSVVDYLVLKGVNSNKLGAVGFGADDPVADNVTEQGKFRNRRIEFMVTNTRTGNTQAVNESTAQSATTGQNSLDTANTTVIATGSGSATAANR